MKVLEGQTFRVADEDLPALRRHLGGLLERRHDGWAVTRMVGHLGLPSGQVLQISSPKATGASVLAWMAYVDPTLRAMRWMGFSSMMVSPSSFLTEKLTHFLPSRSTGVMHRQLREDVLAPVSTLALISSVPG